MPTDERVPEMPTLSYYRLAMRWRVLTYVIGPPMIILFAYVLTLPFSASSPLLYLLIPLALGMIFLFIYGIADAWSGVLVLTEEYVIIKDPFGTRMLKVDDIKGYKIDENYIHLLPLDSTKKKIRISTYLERNDEISDWLAFRFSDLDILESISEENQILRNEGLGITEEARARKLKEARIVAKITNGISWFILAWLLFFPEPYTLVLTVGICFPLLIMVLMYLYRGLMRADEKEKSAYPSMATGLGIIACAVALRAAFDFSILHYNDGWYMMAVMALVLSAIYAIPSGEWKLHKLTDYFFIGAVILIMYAYSFGVCVIANCMLDRSRPASYNSTVIDKMITKGKTYTYYIVLEPWGELPEPERVTVSREEYERVTTGDHVSVIQRKGYLNMPWLVLRFK